MLHALQLKELTHTNSVYERKQTIIVFTCAEWLLDSTCTMNPTIFAYKTRSTLVLAHCGLHLLWSVHAWWLASGFWNQSGLAFRLCHCSKTYLQTLTHCAWVSRICVLFLPRIAILTHKIRCKVRILSCITVYFHIFYVNSQSHAL